MRLGRRLCGLFVISLFVFGFRLEVGVNPAITRGQPRFEMKSMKLTIGQVREALNLSQDAYRYWATALQPVSIRKGRSACFSYGDLLALAIVKVLTDIGVPVGNLDSAARTLFEICGQLPWAKFERQIAVFSPNDRTATFLPEGQSLAAREATILVPCAPILETLRSRLALDQAGEQQAPLRFPLAAVGDGRGRRS